MRSHTGVTLNRLDSASTTLRPSSSGVSIMDTRPLPHHHDLDLPIKEKQQFAHTVEGHSLAYNFQTLLVKRDIFCLWTAID